MSDGRQKKIAQQLSELKTWLTTDENTFVVDLGIKDESRMDYWCGEIRGLVGTPYEGGIYKIEIEFPPDYPFKAFSIKFLNPPYACNIENSGDKRGAISFNDLSNWSPATKPTNLLFRLCNHVFKRGGYECGLQLNPEMTKQYCDNLQSFLWEASVANHRFADGPKPTFYEWPQMDPKTYNHYYQSIETSLENVWQMPASIIDCLIDFYGNAKSYTGLSAFELSETMDGDILTYVPPNKTGDELRELVYQKWGNPTLSVRMQTLNCHFRRALEVAPNYTIEALQMLLVASGRYNIEFVHTTHFIAGGKPMVGKRTLQDYGVSETSDMTIHILHRLTGG